MPAFAMKFSHQRTTHKGLNGQQGQRRPLCGNYLVTVAIKSLLTEMTPPLYFCIVFIQNPDIEGCQSKQFSNARNYLSWIFFPLSSADHIDQYINVNSFKFYKSNLKVDSVFSLFTISNNVSTSVIFSVSQQFLLAYTLLCQLCICKFTYKCIICPFYYIGYGPCLHTEGQKTSSTIGCKMLSKILEHRLIVSAHSVVSSTECTISSDFLTLPILLVPVCLSERHWWIPYPFCIFNTIIVHI